MEENQFSRTALMFGEDGIKRLSEKSVIVFGAGGVGSYVIEALSRAGIGGITIVDNDTVSLSNINRQLIALHSTVGRDKATVAAERVREINPLCRVKAEVKFATGENIPEFFTERYDYAIDAIDNVTAKIALIEYCSQKNIPIISSMGTGSKLDPTRFKITDIYKTSVCPLARVMRYELKKRGIKRLKVLFSDEPPKYAGRPPASVPFVPSVGGLIIAGETIKDLLAVDPDDPARTAAGDGAEKL